MKDNNVTDSIQIEFSGKGKVFGLTIGRTGIGKQTEETVIKDKTALTELYRFSSFRANINTHLVKPFILLTLLILQYPPIPLIATSKTNHFRLQKIQIRALRFA